MSRPKLTTAILLALLMCPWAHSQQPIPSGVRAKSAAQGVLTPWRVIRVASSESGLVHGLMVKPGDLVTTGQPLAVLETEQHKLLIEMAKINAQSTGKVDSARAEVELNQRKLAAIAAGRQKEASTQSELERAEIELRMSQGKLLHELEQRQVEQLNLSKLQVQLKQRSVVAPMAGTIVRIFKEVGEFVAPTSPEVLELVDTSQLRATFYLSAAEVAQLTASGTGKLVLDGGAEHDAKIEFVAPIADGESGLIEVRMLIANPQRAVMGSSCRLRLDTKATKEQA
jgi:RND family efflux transporter MFP subunit